MKSEQIYLYHAMPLSQVKRGVLIADPVYSDEDFLPAYRWLEKEHGFFPLFLAVGTVEEAVYVTGYQNQWRVHTGSERVEGKLRQVYRRAGEFPNYVLFALPVSAVPGIFTDYMWWNIVLTDCMNNTEIGKQLRRYLYKKSWPTHKWLRTARRDGHLVQLIAPQIDLDQASFVWARNRKSAETLRAMGFNNVQVKRLPVEND